MNSKASHWDKTFFSTPVPTSTPIPQDIVTFENLTENELDVSWGINQLSPQPGLVIPTLLALT